MLFVSFLFAMQEPGGPFTLPGAEVTGGPLQFVNPSFEIDAADCLALGSGSLALYGWSNMGAPAGGVPGVSCGTTAGYQGAVAQPIDRVMVGLKGSGNGLSQIVVGHTAEKNYSMTFYAASLGPVSILKVMADSNVIFNQEPPMGPLVMYTATYVAAGTFVTFGFVNGDPQNTNNTVFLDSVAINDPSVPALAV